MTKTERVVEAFGGTTKLANHLRVDRQMIHYWLSVDTIPQKHHGDLILLRKALEIDVSIEDICK